MELQGTYTKAIGFKPEHENRRVVVCRGIVREIPSCSDKGDDYNPRISQFLYNMMENRTK